jgi:hypothetical protein
MLSAKHYIIKLGMTGRLHSNQIQNIRGAASQNHKPSGSYVPSSPSKRH